MARLRLVFKDSAKADIKALQALDGVQGVVTNVKMKRQNSAVSRKELRLPEKGKLVQCPGGYDNRSLPAHHSGHLRLRYDQSRSGDLHRLWMAGRRFHDLYAAFHVCGQCLLLHAH